MKKLINMEDLKKLLRLVLLTGDLKDYPPVSLLIVSKSGNGKTELITSYKKTSMMFLTDLSYVGLLDELKKNKGLKHILIPDFIKITQKKRSTSNHLVSLLNALMEEGVGKIRVFNSEYDFNNRKIGLITATTKASFAQNEKSWSSFGFVQRMLIISFDYNENTIKAIMESINKEEFLKNKPDSLIKLGCDVKSEQKFNSQLNRYSYSNFRNLKQLQALSKAHALSEMRKEVRQCDIDEIIRLTKYMNLRYTKI